jgi:hypothetical protein
MIVLIVILVNILENEVVVSVRVFLESNQTLIRHIIISGNGISLSKQMFILSPSLQLIEHCLGRCDHFSDVYCNGERGLPIFEQHTVTQICLINLYYCFQFKSMANYYF